MQHNAFVEQNPGLSFEDFRITFEENDVQRVKERILPIWIIVQDNATGDQFTLVALLSKKERYTVLITQNRETYDKCQMMETLKKALGEEGLEEYAKAKQRLFNKELYYKIFTKGC